MYVLKVVGRVREVQPQVDSIYIDLIRFSNCYTKLHACTHRLSAEVAVIIANCRLIQTSFVLGDISQSVVIEHPNKQDTFSQC